MTCVSSTYTEWSLQQQYGKKLKSSCPLATSSTVYVDTTLSNSKVLCVCLICVYVRMCVCMCIRDATILQYIDIMFITAIQYNRRISIYCTLQYIVIYCNILQQFFSFQVNYYTAKMTEPLVTKNIQYNFTFLLASFKEMICSFISLTTYCNIWQYIAIHSKAICNMALTHIVTSLMCICTHITHTYVCVCACGCVCVHMHMLVVCDV